MTQQWPCVCGEDVKKNYMYRSEFVFAPSLYLVVDRDKLTKRERKKKKKEMGEIAIWPKRIYIDGKEIKTMRKKVKKEKARRNRGCGSVEQNQGAASITSEEGQERNA